MTGLLCPVQKHSVLKVPKEIAISGAFLIVNPQILNIRNHYEQTTNECHLLKEIEHRLRNFFP